MKLSILVSTFLSTFATGVPDICDDVYVDASGDPITDSLGQTLSRYCKWTTPDAPIWDANVCCVIDRDTARCSKPSSSGRCGTGSTKMYCEYGEVASTGGVVCYQPFPSMCDHDLCIAPPAAPVAQASFVACCNSGGACQPITAATVENCQGSLLSCEYGVLNENGTVDCYD